MLQRAAGNAYSWWWASHIRTKQSKWLEQNLQDMEEKVEHVLNLIQKDGDSFARRAEMYYRHRPELIAFVEETVRAYRALAERYDKLSTDLQKANTTIASICPDQVTYDMDEDDDYTDGLPKIPKNTPQNSPKIPKTPKPPNKAFKGLLKKASRNMQETKPSKTNPAIHVPKSGLTKDEAVDEIDRLQKEILGLQTKKEFMKSSYENSLTQYWDTEKKIMELQEKVCSLQDEFQISKAIEDNEARNLMAEAALKSCEETLDGLHEKHEKSSQDAKFEHQRIHEAKQKLKSLKAEESEPKPAVETERADEPCGSNQDDRKEAKEGFEDQLKKPETVPELAETIDNIVSKVISLESSVSSQNAYISTLRTEADALQTQIQKLENDKAALIDESQDLDKKLKKMEEKLDNGHATIDESEKRKISSPDGEKEIDWQQMLLSGLEDKEKILLEEYLTILRNYKDTKKKLNEEEKRNQGTDSQVQELQSAIDKRDHEVRLLKQKLKLLQETFGNEDEEEGSEDVPLAVSAVEEKRRAEIDVILEENLDFWMRFSAAFHQIQKFKTEVEDSVVRAKLVSER